MSVIVHSTIAFAAAVRWILQIARRRKYGKTVNDGTPFRRQIDSATETTFYGRQRLSSGALRS